MHINYIIVKFKILKKYVIDFLLWKKIRQNICNNYIDKKVMQVKNSKFLKVKHKY